MTHVYRTLLIVCLLLAGECIGKDELIAGGLLAIAGSVCGAVYDRYSRKDWSDELDESEDFKDRVRQHAKKMLLCWEPICPEQDEIFVIEGLAKDDVGGFPSWTKLGASFFEKEADAIAADFTRQGKTARYRKFTPSRAT